MKKLKFTKKAIYRLEKEKDVKIGELQKMTDPAEFKFSIVIDLIWAGSLWRNPSLTTDQVIDEIDFSEMDKYAKMIENASDEAFGDIQAQSNDDSPKEGNSTSRG